MQGSLQHWLSGRNNTYLCCTSLQPENVFKVQGQAGATLPQKAFTEVAGALHTCSGSSCGPMYLHRSLCPRQRIYSNALWDHQAASGRAAGPSQRVAPETGSPGETQQWLTWGVIAHAEGGPVRQGESGATPHRRCSCQSVMLLETGHVFSLLLQKSSERLKKHTYVL